MFVSQAIFYCISIQSGQIYCCVRYFSVANTLFCKSISHGISMLDTLLLPSLQWYLNGTFGYVNDLFPSKSC